MELESVRPNKTLDLSGCTIQGQVYLLKQIVEDGEPFHYKYLYGDVGSKEPSTVANGYEIVETIPWGMKKWHRKIVSRDRAWYQSTIPWQDTFWTDVERVRNGQDLVVPVANSSSTKTQECLIQDSD